MKDIIYRIFWRNPRQGTQGQYPETFTTQGKAWKAREQHNRKHVDRAHGIIARTGGDDGR